MEIDRKNAGPISWPAFLCEPARNAWTFRKNVKIGNKNARRGSRSQRFVRACAIENAHGHFTRASLCGNLNGNSGCVASIFVPA